MSQAADAAESGHLQNASVTFGPSWAGVGPDRPGSWCRIMMFSTIWPSGPRRWSEPTVPGSRCSIPAGWPVSFPPVFNTAAQVLAQGGRRRGASMAVLDVTHPDIAEFIDAKQAGA
jgi:hypothetical protein